MFEEGVAGRPRRTPHTPWKAEVYHSTEIRVKVGIISRAIGRSSGSTGAAGQIQCRPKKC